MERVREDLREPHETRLNVTDEEQVHRAEEQAADTHREPHLADVLHELFATRVRLEHTE